MQPCKTPEVTGDAEVCIMPLQHLAQSVMLNVQRPMHHHAALLIEPPERALKPFFRRELAHNLVAFPRDTPRRRNPRNTKVVGNVSSPPRDLVKEWKATGPTYRTTLRTVIRNSYAGHYRRMVPKLLAALDFRSNNERHRPVMQALELVKRFADTKLRTFPAEEEVPLDGVVRGLWRDAAGEKDAAGN